MTRAQLRMSPISHNGGTLAADEFGYRTIQGGVGFAPAGIEAIVFRCPNGANRQCEIPLTLGDPVENVADRRWHWDGNMLAPTIMPSIGCDQRCGWHGNITAGVAQSA